MTRPSKQQQALSWPCLALVTDRTLCWNAEELIQKVDLALDGGVGMVQLREKDLPAGELLPLAQRLRALTLGRALFLVNDRLDVALACDADGVHLPEAGLPPDVAQRMSGGRLLVGRSVHSVEAAQEAERAGADYLIVGTIFATRSHLDFTPAGTGLLSQVTEAVSLPFLAIGGIDRNNVGQVIQAGAWGAAVISALLRAPDPRSAARELVEQMQAAWTAERRVFVT